MISLYLLVRQIIFVVVKRWMADVFVVMNKVILNNMRIEIFSISIWRETDIK